MLCKLNPAPNLRKRRFEEYTSGYSYESESYLIQLGIMFGFLKEKDGLVCIANRIFEMKLYNLFLSEEETGAS